VNETFNSYSLAGEDPNPQTVDEVNYLKELVQSLPQNPVIVNIGAERGTSTIAMLETRPDAYIFSIDTDECDGERKNAERAGMDLRHIVRVLGRSQEIGKFWPYVVDMVFIDGDHHYEGVKGDIAVWKGLVVSGGILAFHDYFEGPPPAHNPSGAGEAVREMMVESNDVHMIRLVDRLMAFRKK